MAVFPPLAAQRTSTGRSQAGQIIGGFSSFLCYPAKNLQRLTQETALRGSVIAWVSGFYSSAWLWREQANRTPEPASDYLSSVIPVDLSLRVDQWRGPSGPGVRCCWELVTGGLCPHDNSSTHDSSHLDRMMERVLA